MSLTRLLKRQSAFSVWVSRLALMPIMALKLILASEVEPDLKSQLNCIKNATWQAIQNESLQISGILYAGMEVGLYV